MEPLTVPTKQAPDDQPSRPPIAPSLSMDSGANVPPGPNSNQPDRPPNGRAARPRRDHRRISSEDWSRNFASDGAGNGGGAFAYPYPPAHYNPYQQQQPPPMPPTDANGNGNGNGNQADGGQFQNQQHSRQRSWSGNFIPYGQGGMNYPPSPSPAQQGQMQMQGQVFGAPPYPGNTIGNNVPQKSKRRSGSHRRVRSYSGGPSYGSIDMAATAPPPLPTTRNRADFSPRNEFMKLASSYRAPPQQSTIGSMSPNSSLRNYPPSPNMSSMRGVQTMNGDEQARVSFSPQTPINGADTTIMGSGVVSGVYGMDAPGSIALPHPFAGPSNGAPPSPSMDMSGEAVFMANKRSQYKKSPSSRKMHMRQQSAQLFMEEVKGVEQNPRCRDISFLLLFLFHILGIVFLGNTYGYEGLLFHDESAVDTSVTLIYRNVVYVACLSGIFAITISALTLLLMTVVVKKIVQLALVVTITLSFAWGTIGIGLSPKKLVPATGIVALALSVAYTFIVWDRIPFAAANLNAALNGIRANPGTVLVAFFFQLVGLAWSIYFTYVVVGVYDAIEVGDLELSSDGTIAMYCVLGVSFYWTFNVFLNIVQATVAGVIGSWWYTPDGETQNRSNDLSKAIFRSSFYALGSICYGSLFVGPVRMLRQISALFRPSGDDSPLLFFHECLKCIQTCVSSGIDSLSVRFSPWALTYVGLYGYGLVEGGTEATELFVKRGWTTIVSDDLVPNVLLLTSLVIGGITGCFAHLIANFESLSFTSMDEPVVTTFVAGLIVGLVVTSILFSIISSSVNAVIVCFAASPVDFEHNHPSLSEDMRNSWREVWPGCMDVLDMRMTAASYLDPSTMALGIPPPIGPPPPIQSEIHPLLA